MDRNKRWRTTLEVAVIQLAMASGVGVVFAHYAGARGQDYYPILGVPALATALFVGVAGFYEALVSSPIRFPLNLTLPLVYCCFLPVSAVIIATPDQAFMKTREPVEYADMWRKAPSLEIVFLGQAVALTLLAVATRKSD